MERFERAHWLKVAILVVYVAVIVGFYVFLHQTGIPVTALPSVVKNQVLAAGMFGPLVLILFYLISTVIPFPTAAIAVIGGVIYGPWLGSLTVVVGVNAAGMASFWLARYFGRHFVSESEKGWVKQYDDLLTKQGMYAVMALRLLFFPFDAVSIGCGLTRMNFREYVLGSFLGSFASTVSFVVLGESLTTPRTWFLFGALMIGSILVAILIRRSAWANKHIFVTPKEPKTFE